jgi:hypothetical protein
MLTPNPSKKYKKNSGEQSYQRKSDIKNEVFDFLLLYAKVFGL